MYEIPSHKLFGKRLKYERNRLKFTQEKFAELGGVRRATQYMYEQGERYPSAEYLARLISVGLDIGFLFFGQGTKSFQGGLYVDKDALIKAFKLADELGRDSKGRLLDVAYRVSSFELVCNEIENKPLDEIGWKDMRALLTSEGSFDGDA